MKFIPFVADGGTRIVVRCGIGLVAGRTWIHSRRFARIEYGGSGVGAVGGGSRDEVDDLDAS